TYGFSQNQKNYFVDQSLNGRQALQKAAQQHSGQNAFQLFSHGRPGELLINGQWLNAKQIADWLTNEQGIQSTLQQLNIYGCNFAKGAKGREAVAYLEKTLGISIAASDDITGKDGDWELEIGNAQNALALNYYPYALVDTDGDGVEDPADLDDDNDGILDVDECTTSDNLVRTTVVQEFFDNAIVGQKVPLSGGTGGLPIFTSIVDSYNDFDGTNSSSHNGEIKNVSGPFGSATNVIDANGMASGVDFDRQSQYTFYQGIDLTKGQKWTIGADFYFTYGTDYPSNEFGTILHAPNQDAIWQDDVIDSIDGIATYRDNIILLRHPNSSIAGTGAQANYSWRRQEAIYYTAFVGADLHLFVDVRTAVYSAGTLGAYTTNNNIDLGLTSAISWINNASIGITVDSYADNIEIYFEECDFDGDGIPNIEDTDSDNDGCPDATEGASNLTTTAKLTGGSNGGSSEYLGTTADSSGRPNSGVTQGRGASQVDNDVTPTTSHQCNDFGDAPNSYSTNRTDAGPSHPLVLGEMSTLYLGATQAGLDDGDLAVAGGGDANAPHGDGAEEDGVTFRSPGGTGQTIYADVVLV
ncbi:MAG: DUF4347 domain-containing protein, partial [Desulfobulbaceae bacterium]|nr:DUF4347 domain-containing protein [Desulfobulbaceae bacterium]